MEKIVEQFHTIDTSTISDALDKNGLTGQCLGIKSFNPGWKIAGRAFTLKYGPVDIVKGTVGDFIDDVPEGGVVVLDNQGRLDCTVWGDILTSVAKRRARTGSRSTASTAMSTSPPSGSAPATSSWETPTGSSSFRRSSRKKSWPQLSRSRPPRKRSAPPPSRA